MKRAASATFLLFYTALTVVAISEHTAAYASTIAHSPLRAQTVRASSPHSSQARILQEPFAGFQVMSGFALGEYGPTSVRPASLRFEVDTRRFTPSRAPPAFL
jgi:hypothetical protein